MIVLKDEKTLCRLICKSWNPEHQDIDVSPQEVTFMEKKMSETVKMFAYEIKAKEVLNPETNILGDYLRYLTQISFKERWLPLINNQLLDAEETYRNIKSFEQLPLEDCDNHTVYYGAFLEMICKPFEALKIDDGKENQVSLPDGHGQKNTKWEFTIAPDYNLLILENATFSENKLQEYLNSQTVSWNNKYTNKHISNVIIKGIPLEENPAGWMRKNLGIGSCKVKIKASALEEKYGVLSDLFTGLGEEKDYLTLTLEVGTSRRKEALPELAVTGLANIIETFDSADISNTSVKEFQDGKKSRRNRKLLNALLNKEAAVTEEKSKKDNLIDFTIETIGNLSNEES